MYQKRNEMDKKWPLTKKGTKYIVRALDNSSLPLLIALRDMLKLGKNRNEVKEILKTEKIKVNGKVIKNERYPLSLFDVLTTDKDNYKLSISEKRKYFLEKISEKETEEKIAKIINKKMLKNGIQINLSDGRNYIIKEKAKTGDSAVISLKENKIKGFLELKEGARVLVTGGKHIGKKGVIKKLIKKDKEIAELDSKLNVWTKNIIVVK